MVYYLGYFRDRMRISYLEKTRNLPLEKLRKGGWRRVVNEQELAAIEWWVASVLEVQYEAENAIRNIIVGGNVRGIVKQYKQCIADKKHEAFLKSGYRFRNDQFMR